MAYNLAYQGEFTNRRTNNIRLEIYQKDFVPPVTTLSNKEIIAVSVGYPNGNESKYNTIIGAEANITLRVRSASTITPETFLTDLYDEWKVLIYCDTMLVFAGFIEPSEGNYLMKDAPVQIDVKCTDGLGLLKNVTLTDTAGDSFLNTTPYLIDVVAGCLAKTNLELPIRIYCSIFESSMQDREDDITKDMFNQARTDYRTFLQNANTFVDCYKALEMLLTGGFSIYQWFGRWTISYRPEMQASIGPTLYYSDYDNAGVVTAGNQDLGIYYVIGYDQIQHPINLDQIISYQVPAKSVKNTFNYTVWDEIPKNNKFERGAEFESGSVSSPPGTYKKSTIDDWLYGITNPSVGSTQPPNGMLATTDLSYRMSTYDQFNIETIREVVLERTGDPQAGHRFLRSDGIPVNAGDKIRITTDYKTSAAGTGTRQYMMVMLEVASGTPYRLDQVGGAPVDGIGILFWAQTTAMRFLAKDYQTGEDASQYSSFTLDPPQLPADGTLYILFMMFDPPVGRVVSYKNFSFEYFPSVAGSYAQVKGDYWLTSQDRNVKDAIDEEVFISDSTKKVLKGSLLRADGTTLTTPTWYRQGQAETKHFKELLNLGKYRHYYRRFRKIQGTFRGVKSTPVNFLGDFYPIGFHKHYAFINNDGEKMYVFSPPTTIDYVAGTFNTTAIEALDSGNTVEGGVTADQVVNQLIFRINNTTEAEWNSASGAPPSGTPYFPPVAAVYPNTPRSFSIFLDDGNTATAAVVDGGAGNSPSITEIYNADLGNLRWQIFQVAEDVEVGNLFTVTIYGHDVSFTANTPAIFVDENQNGDTHQFGYIF